MLLSRKVIAFIPVRGGSKSIPLKNIKPLCGKPLVCWSIEALEQCNKVDEIIVATDSDEICSVVIAGNYKKTSIFHRSAENASDAATTESVMLEYIKSGQLCEDTIFMLVQATSPLTNTCHFDSALDMFASKSYDSILSCVNNYRFFWNEDGTPNNYNFLERPRRQNFSGILMENGALYINTVGGILSNGNRLGGRIGIFIMPEYTAIEIDEPDDWLLMERLMLKYRANKYDSINIKLFISDVDGTLTDGGMYYSESGEELKKFNTRDGMGFQRLRDAGIKTAIITSENTNIVTKRANKLKCDFLVQGKTGQSKLDSILEICDKRNISINEVAYIGDDINCLSALENVGMAACPADAMPQIKEIPHIIILTHKGGAGCVREFAEIILNNKKA